MLLRPRRNRARLAFTSRRTRLRVRERPQLPRTLFRGSIAWLIGSLSTLRRNGLPRSHARLARGCWLNSAARDSHPLGFTERFQLCFSFYIASSSRELTWRNPVKIAAAISGQARRRRVPGTAGRDRLQIDQRSGKQPPAFQRLASDAAAPIGSVPACRPLAQR